MSDVSKTLSWRLFSSGLAESIGEIPLQVGTGTVAGIVTIDGVPAINGSSIEIFADDGESSSTRIQTVLVAGDLGAFTCTVDSLTLSYFASYADATDAGRSLLGTASEDTFNITIGAAPSGTEGMSRARVVNV